MQITIDTNNDSKEHIQHMIEFLQRFVGSQPSGSSTASGGMMGMFDAPSSSSPSDAPSPQPGIFGLFDDGNQSSGGEQPPEEKPEPDDSIEIIPY